MKKGTIRDTIVKKLEKRIREAEVEELRKSVTTDRVQLLFLENLEWVDEAVALTKEQDAFKGRLLKYSTGKNRDKYLKTAQDLARIKHDRFMASDAQGYAGIISQLDNKKNRKIYDRLGKDVFVIGSYSTVGALKREILSAILKPSHKAYEKEIANRVDIAHGAETGTAVSMLNISRTASALGGLDSNALEKVARAAIKAASQEATLTKSEENLIKELIVNYNVRYNSAGKLQANYLPFVTYQDRFTNRGRDQKREEFLTNTINSFFGDLAKDGSLVNIEGSDSIEVQAGKYILEQYGKKAKRAPKYKGKRVPGKGREKGKTSKTSKKKISPKKPSIVSVKSGGSTTPSLHMLIGVLNQQLSEAVAANMESPRLNYRTGRFAASVRVTDIATTAKGFPSIGYTYQTYPYQTFEPGYAQGSVDRDPRKLIDKSIRDIAIQFAIGRFYTRRV